jgi:NADPH:quinone reductase
MKAIRVVKPGGREALRYMDVPDPRPERGQVLVALEFAGVNFFDVYQRAGTYPIPVPFTLGTEAAGIVVAVGSDVSDFKSGDRVAYQEFRARTRSARWRRPIDWCGCRTASRPALRPRSCCRV